MKPVDQARNALGFLEDETHEHAFDKLIWGLRERRDAAAREVPEWEQLRTLASQIKEHTLANLAHYLELFEARATRNGAQVHWARDAHEHNLDRLRHPQLARCRQLVKSMLTEECDLRPFLERRGIQVTETDLGERIQQLAGATFLIGAGVTVFADPGWARALGIICLFTCAISTFGLATAEPAEKTITNPVFTAGD